MRTGHRYVENLGNSGILNGGNWTEVDVVLKHSLKPVWKFDSLNYSHTL